MLEDKNIEEWKQIKEFPRYYISSNGRVKSFVRSKEIILKPTNTNAGYQIIKLYNKNIEPKEKTIRLHRLVAQYFVKGFSAEIEVHHINGNRKDNRAENLQCLTRQQHQQKHKTTSAEKEVKGVENCTELENN